ncbi:MAG: efflux RND transporter periplasmic adaptor subunit, partial [Candidatus Paceibacterota bacterium]
RSSALDKIRDSYLKASDAVNTQIDPLLNNYDGNGSRLVTFVGDLALSNRITSERVDLTDILPAWKSSLDALSSDSDTDTLISAVNLSEKNLALIDKLLSDISEGLNTAAKYAQPNFATFLNNWKGIVSGARSTISGSTQALTGAESALTAAQTGYSGASIAQVSLAEAGVKNLQAQLEKTIVRSPIDGKIAALPLEVGELASPGGLLVTVVGNRGLQVKAYVSGVDFDRIKEGASVLVQGKVKGQVESVAPSVSATNRKVEVTVSVLDSVNSGLIIGQTIPVTVSLAKTNVSTSRNNAYLLPIQDVKIVPGDAYVFTVDADSKIKRNPVILGPVSGDFIEITSGLTDDMSIVSPVYELDEGQIVEVEQ